jgi:hypothetical protein
MGEIYVKWEKREEKTFLSLVVPFGMEAEVTLPEGKRTLPCGTYAFEVS